MQRVALPKISPVSSRPDSRGADARAPGRPSLLVGSGHLAALWALAFAQPLFDLLGRNPDFFVARGNSAADILIFSLVFTFAPPLVMLAAEAVVERLDPNLRWGLHLFLVALLLAAIALQVLKEVATGPAGVLIALALIAGALGATAYARTRFWRGIADVLIPAPAIVLALFLLFSDVSELVLPQSEAKAASVEIPGRAPVVEVIFDEFPVGALMDRRGRIDASRYPAFAELASSSIWYRGATAVSGFTPRATPAILTGRLAGEDDLPISADHPRSVFTLLGGTYRMHVMEAATRVCPSGLCGDDARISSQSDLGSLFADLRVVSEHLLLPDGIRTHLPAVDQGFGDFANEIDTEVPRSRLRDPDQVAWAIRRTTTNDEAARMAGFIAALDGSDQKLHLIHLEEPHAPWTHLPGGRTYTDLSAEFDDVLAEDSTWLGPRSLTDMALQRHLLEVGFTDHLLGELIAHMKRTGLWQRALLVVVADHGNAVIPHVPRRNPTPANLGQVAGIPLFVKAPGQRQGRVVDRHFCTTDVLPITARLLGIAYPWPHHHCPPGRVTVADSAEGGATLPFSDFVRKRDAFVARITRTFGSGNGWGSVIRFRPHRELVGMPVAKLATVPPSGTSACLDDPERLRDVDPRAPVVLASLLRGSISGGRPGEALALAVNGQVAAVGRSFASAGSVRYSLLVPPRYLRPDANRVELYRVLGTGPGVRLQPLGP